MFKYHHHLLPECFDNLFITNNQVHSCNTIDRLQITDLTRVGQT